MSAESGELKVLLLCNYETYGSNANTIVDYVDAFSNHSRHAVVTVSHMGELPEFISLDWFDVVVIHYSITLVVDCYISPATRRRLAEYRGLKVLIIQDEYRVIFDFLKMIDLIRFDVLFTCLPPAVSEHVYPKHVLPRLRVEQCLTGYVPENLLDYEPVPMTERNLDVFYRARKLAYWHGSVGQEKWRIVDLVQGAFAAHGLRTDLAYKESDRIYGDQWIERLRHSRSVLGVESAVSVFDFTGEVERRTLAFASRCPDASFEEAEAACFPGMDGRFDIAQISPRCFEAVALRTGLVLLEGQYSGILQPWRHYLPLKRDGSNLDQVAACIQDADCMETMTERAFSEVAANEAYSYRAFVRRFDEICDCEVVRRRTARTSLAASDLRNRVEELRSRGLTEFIRRKVGSIPRAAPQAATGLTAPRHNDGDGPRAPHLAHKATAAASHVAQGGAQEPFEPPTRGAGTGVQLAKPPSQAQAPTAVALGPEIVVVKAWKSTRHVWLGVRSTAGAAIVRGIRLLPRPARALLRRLFEFGSAAGAYLARNV